MCAIGHYVCCQVHGGEAHTSLMLPLFSSIFIMSWLKLLTEVIQPSNTWVLFNLVNSPLTLPNSQVKLFLYSAVTDMQKWEQQLPSGWLQLCWKTGEAHKMLFLLVSNTATHWCLIITWIYLKWPQEFSMSYFYSAIQNHNNILKMINCGAVLLIVHHALFPYKRWWKYDSPQVTASALEGQLCHNDHCHWPD